jgi:hypothetical protein
MSCRVRVAGALQMTDNQVLIFLEFASVLHDLPFVVVGLVVFFLPPILGIFFTHRVYEDIFQPVRELGQGVKFELGQGFELWTLSSPHVSPPVACVEPNACMMCVRVYIAHERQFGVCVDGVVGAHPFRAVERCVHTDHAF